MKKADIINRVSYRTVDSNFCYPRDTGWYDVLQIVQKDAEILLERHFKVAGIRINNKYVVRVNDYQGKERFIYNHDGRYYLVDKTPEDRTKTKTIKCLKL